MVLDENRNVYNGGSVPRNMGLCEEYGMRKLDNVPLSLKKQNIYNHEPAGEEDYENKAPPTNDAMKAKSRQTEPPALFQQQPQQQRMHDNNLSYQVPPYELSEEQHHQEFKKSTTRAEHKQKVLQLCQDKLTATTESKVIVNAMKDLYKTEVLPIETQYHLHGLCLPTSGTIQDSELDARPMVLLLGQYSTGKTSFIRHLLGVDFPGMHIGPEPTSDKFMALVHGNDHKIIKGNTLTVLPDLPFMGLSQFGSRFLNHFNGSVANSPLLQFMNMIDTPGILSGEKQRLSREYDFSQTAKWFADRSDLILLLFDAHKLDISDEFKQVVETIRPHNDDKIRCVLNKADVVEKDQLVRVYGSLMWSMGKLFSTPEVVRVYTGSYWDKELVHNDFEDMFNADEEWLLDELMRLPSVSAERKMNAMVQRIRLIKVHLCLLGYIRQQMPRFFGRTRARQHILKNLESIFESVKHQYDLSQGDMPDIEEFRQRLAAYEDFSIFPTLDPQLLDHMDNLWRVKLPEIMGSASRLAREQEKAEEEERQRQYRQTMELEEEQRQREIQAKLAAFAAVEAKKDLSSAVRREEPLPIQEKNVHVGTRSESITLKESFEKKKIDVLKLPKNQNQTRMLIFLFQIALNVLFFGTLGFAGKIYWNLRSASLSSTFL